MSGNAVASRANLFSVCARSHFNGQFELRRDCPDAIERLMVIAHYRFAHAKVEPQVTRVVHGFEHTKELSPVDGTVANGKMLGVDGVIVRDMNVGEFSLELRQAERGILALRRKVARI